MLPFPASLFGREAVAAAGGGNAVAPDWGAVGTHSAGSITAAYPTGIAAGDLLVATVVANGVNTDTSFSAAGWTELTQYRSSATAATGTTGYMLAVLYKVATGSESGSLAISQTGTANRAGAVIERYSGVDTSGVPFEGLQTAEFPSNSTTLNVPAVTTTADGRLIVNKFGTGLVIAVTEETGWTEAWEFGRGGVGPDYLFATHYKDAVGSGLQDSETATPASQNGYITVSFALIGVAP